MTPNNCELCPLRSALLAERRIREGAAVVPRLDGDRLIMDVIPAGMPKIETDADALIELAGGITAFLRTVPSNTVTALCGLLTPLRKVRQAFHDGPIGAAPLLSALGVPDRLGALALELIVRGGLAAERLGTYDFGPRLADDKTERTQRKFRPNQKELRRAAIEAATKIQNHIEAVRRPVPMIQ